VTGGKLSPGKRRLRAGAHFLLMAADPINRGILRTVLERPVEMEPGHLYKVSSGGREVLFIAFAVERWLQSAPQGPIKFDSRQGEAAVVALAEGWSATVMHALAREPLTFHQLHGAVDGIGRRALKRHLTAMQRAGQVEAHHGGGAGAIYVVTDWLRTAIAPLAVAARLERREPKEGLAPIEALDVEAAFLLTLPLLELPKELSGVCRLGVNLEDEEGSGLTGVTARIEQGRVVSCSAGLDCKADAWAAATAGDWLDTVIEPDAKQVRTGGDRWLAAAVLGALHKTLFGILVA
jgi:DNA-binding HxlR family transcriptional regulator